MLDLENHVHKIRKLFQKSVAAVPIADEVAAHEALESYRHRQNATNRLFDLLITLENTGQTVGTVRALANHFYMANVLDGISMPIAEALSNIAACLPGIVQTNGAKIPSGPIQPGTPRTPEVTAFVVVLDTESAWMEAMLIGRALAVLKEFPYSNARVMAVADAATRIKQRGYTFSIQSGRYEIKSETIENIVGDIWKCLGRMGSVNALGNIMQVAYAANDYGYEQFLFGRKYSPGFGSRPPSLPIGLLYNIAVKLPARGSNERKAESFWGKAAALARDFVAMLNLEPYSQFAFLGVDAKNLEDGLREVAHYDHCFSLRQWHLSLTPQFLSTFFGSSFDSDMKMHFGWNVADAVKLAQILAVYAKPGTEVISIRLIENSFAPGVFQSMLPYFAYKEGKVNEKYRSPFGADGPDVIFKPLILLNGGYIVLPAASILGPALFEATFAAWKIEKTDKEISILRRDGAELLTKYIFGKRGLKPSFENAKYVMGKQGDGECDFVFEDEENIILVECKAKPLTRGAMTGTQGDALLDFAGGLFASQAQALRHERILRSSKAISFIDGTKLEFLDRQIIRLSVTLVDHGALQDRWMLRNVYNALLFAECTCSPDYSKKKQVTEFNKNLRKFQDETRLLEAAGQHIDAHPLNAASVSVAQLDILLDGTQSLTEVRERLSSRMTFSTFNVLLEHFNQQKIYSREESS